MVLPKMKLACSDDKSEPYGWTM